MENTCPKTPTCRLFNGDILQKNTSEEIYKALFCTAGIEKFSTCMRMRISQKYGKCPDFVLPNSSFTEEQILEKLNSEEVNQ